MQDVDQQSQSALSVSIRLIVLGLIAVEAAALSLFPREFVAASLIMVAAVYVLFAERQLTLKVTPSRIVTVLAALFLLKYTVAPPHFRPTSLAVRTQLLHTVGQFCVAWQLLTLATRKRVASVPWSIPCLGCVVMLCAADVFVSLEERTWFQFFVASFAILVAALLALNQTHCANGREAGPVRTVLLGVLILATGFVSFQSASLLYHHERDLENLLSRLLEPPASEAGFADSGFIGSVSRRRSMNDDVAVIRVYSDTPPGYLRGRVFERYVERCWLTPSPQRRRLSPIDFDGTKPGRSKTASTPRRLFTLRDEPDMAEVKRCSRMEFWPSANGRGDILTPDRMRYFGADIDQVVLTLNHLVKADSLPVGDPYWTLHDQSAKSTPTETESMSIGNMEPVLDGMHADVRKLARRLFKGCETNAEKIAAVEQYFYDSYEYSLEPNIPAGHDPISWFLLEKPAGHCELFASATVALLRLGDVPARYVTGFVSDEKNRYGDYWVARNRNAHAWAEIWQQDVGWVIVETTPASGVPLGTATPSWWEFYEYVRDGIQMFRVRLANGGMRWLLSAIVGVLVHPLSLAALLLWIVTGLVWYSRRRQQQRRTFGSPLLAELHALLMSMDRQMQRTKVLRAPHETPHQFAARLEQQPDSPDGYQQQADWYRRWSALRFGGTATMDAVRELKATL